MKAVRYGDYSRDSTGWFLGMTGTQLALVAAGAVPALLAFSARAWPVLLAWLPVWALLIVAVLVPVHGRSTARWFADLCRYVIGGLMRWNRFASRAAAGTAGDLAETDLPGVLAGIRVHDGPPFGRLLTRPALVQDRAGATWAAVARIVHPGIGLAEPEERDRMGAGLAELCETVARIELVDRLALQVRTVPDDGAERAAWERTHKRADAPAVARNVTGLLARTLLPATVRTEAFMTVVVGETRIGRAAKGAGGGVDGRARVLHGVMAEVEAGLRGGVGCPEVAWLDSASLAAAVRMGFAPGDRAELVAADLACPEDGIAAGIPVAAAGPTQARTEVRHYCHDAWASVTATVLLPDQGAVLGALAPVLVPTTPGERRCVTVFLQPLGAERATRMVGREEMSATTGNEVRARMGFRQRARQRRDTERIAAADEKLAAGRALVRAAAAACVTVPASWPVTEYGRRLSASVRAAGYVPLLLDLAQDSGFAAAAIPLGVGLPDRRGRR